MKLHQAKVVLSALLVITLVISSRAETTKPPDLPPDSDDLQKKLDDSNEKLAASQATSNQLAELANGTLVEKAGITGGVGLALQIPNGRLRSTKAVAIPYIAVLPGYWMGSLEKNRYCAVLHGGGDSLAALESAEALSKARGMKKLEVLIRQLSVQSQKPKDAVEVIEGEEPEVDAAIKECTACRECRSCRASKQVSACSQCGKCSRCTGVDSSEKSRRLKAWLDLLEIARAVRSKMYPELKDADGDVLDGTEPEILGANEKASFAERIASIFWTQTSPANCFGERLGIFVGVPFSYEAQTEFRDDDPYTVDENDFVRDTRNVRPRVAFGFTFALNTWLHLLTGVTYAEAIVGEEGGNEDDFRSLWIPTVAAGGTLDIVNVFR